VMWGDQGKNLSLFYKFISKLKINQLLNFQDVAVRCWETRKANTYCSYNMWATTWWLGISCLERTTVNYT